MFQSVLQLGCAAMVPATLAAWRPGLRPGAEEAAAECGGRVAGVRRLAAGARLMAQGRRGWGCGNVMAAPEAEPQGQGRWFGQDSNHHEIGRAHV